MTEKELLIDYATKRQHFDQLTKDTADAKTDKEYAEEQLVNLLVELGATATAKYDGIGRFNLQKPAVKAGVTVDNTELFHQHLKENDSESLIKEGVHWSTLNTYVAGLIEKGEEIPAFISYVIVQKGKFYPEK